MNNLIPKNSSDVKKITQIITREKAQEVLEYLDDSYYNTEKPSLPDALYDEFRDALNSKFPDLKEKVGAIPSLTGRVVPLTIQMGSLKKMNTQEEFSLFYNKYTSGSIVGSLKLDGYSAEIVYKNGKLLRGTTRGNGVLGKDITSKVLKIPSIPKELKNVPNGELVVRGEIYLKKTVFEKFFRPLGKENPRNSIAGPLNSLDGEMSEYLEFSPFDLLMPDSSLFINKKADLFITLKELGFDVAEFKEFNSIADAQSFFEEVANRRNNLDFLIDGIVFEENDLNLARELGEVDNRPRASRAYKFENEASEATLLDVEWNVGRTGKVTPTAILTPCYVGGVTITRGTLNNPSYIEGLGIRIGSKVLLERANDVIPKVSGVLSEGVESVKVPEQCPSCGNELVNLKDKNIQCLNSKTCPSQVVERVNYFLKTLEVKGVGEGIIKALSSAGILKETKDLFQIKETPIEGVSWVNFNKAQTSLLELSQRGIDLSQFIESLGINGIGKSASGKIAKIINSKLNGDILEVLVAPDVINNSDILGTVVKSDFLEGVREKECEIRNLLELIKINPPSESKSSATGKYSGEVFCFSGFRDKDLSNRLISLGGEVVDTLSKKVTTLIVKDTNSTSSKIQKAQKMKIRVVCPEEI